MATLKEIQELSNQIDTLCADMGESGLSISELRYEVKKLQDQRAELIKELK